MNPRAKNAVYAVLLILTTWAVWKYRQSNMPGIVRLEGKTMATTYRVTYFDPSGRNFQASIDSLLVEVNKSINTYDSSSEVSRFNRSDRSFRFERRHFYEALRISHVVVTGSMGAYDPTIMPLVNAWGFGPRKVEKPDTAEILAIREFIGFEKISFNEDSVRKSNPKVQLDFGGIGQGYGADVMADFLRQKHIENFFVELGGEGVAAGKNLAENRPWEIGILDPNAGAMEQSFIARAKLSDKAFSTSGNYFNYREVDGKKYAHTIDPESGFPVQRALLSATVFAADCATADAWATAFMCMGHESAITLVNSHHELDVYLVFTSQEGISTYTSPAMQKFLTSDR